MINPVDPYDAILCELLNQYVYKEGFHSMKKHLFFALCLCAVPAYAMANSTTVEAVSYACDNNGIMKVAFVNGADGESFAILLQMDEMIPLAQEVSASGAIYKAISPDYTYTLSTKGKEAFLEDRNGVILSGCSY